MAAVITPEGTRGRPLRRAVEGRFELIVSPKGLAGLQRVLDRPNFRRYLTPAEAGQVVQLIAHLAILVPDPDPAPQGLCPDPRTMIRSPSPGRRG